MEIIKNKSKWLTYSKRCIEHYNINNYIISDTPNEYPCIVVPQLIYDVNGARIKFNFIYKKDCRKLLKVI